jgi:hypothetical protein
VERPLRHLEPPLPGHDGRGPGGLEVVEPLAALAADVEEIGEPLGRDERRPRELPLEQGVRGDRGPVDDPGVRVLPSPGPLEAGEDRPGGVPGRGRELDVRRPVRAEPHEIGEGAAGVDAVADVEVPT